ncbi:hypothetical protein LTR17_015665 [Elasticomyces elasticus]|nr:hypothetical protein LTR17_015665 [Elasticomyces elasticus]
MSDTGLQSRKFIYSNLGFHKIRLLHLLSGDWNDEICCVVFEADLQHQNIEYEAVSYTWGDPARPNNSVRVINSPDGKVPRTTGNVMEVSEGTFEALRRLRPGKDQVPRTLWMDAICINQDNVHERNSQVLRMKDIFSGARRVVAYVGESADDSSVLFEAMEASQKSHVATLDGPGVSEVPVGNPMRRCLENFLRRRWFSRIWAKEIILICGDSHTSWEAFQAAVRARYPEHAIAGPLPAVLLPKDWVAWGVLQALQTTRMCDATDDRDKIYGVAALLHLGQALMGSQRASAVDANRTLMAERQRLAERTEYIPSVDYNKSRGSIFFELADAQLSSPSTQTRLDLFSYVQSEPGTPSWVPDWTVHSGQSVIAFDAPNGGYWKTLYFAGGHCEDRLLLKHGSRLRDGRWFITVEVIVLYTVQEVARVYMYHGQGPRMSRESGLRSWDHMISSASNHGSLVPGDTFLEELGLAPRDYGIRMSINRRLMLLSNHSYALGPAEAQVNDTVCVMIGAAVPFVIRGGTGKEGSAVLVGECWVKDVMQGEAIRQKDYESCDKSFTVSEEFERRGHRVERLDLF